jgi:putative phosphoesterase
MRLGLIADVHADPRALESALRHLEHHGVDRILCAGDVVGYGDDADAAVALLRDRSVSCIRGNHDRWALERRRVIGARGWKAAMLRDETWEFLNSLPASEQYVWAGRAVSMFHGSPGSDTERVTPYNPLPASVDRHWEERGDDVLILGHTHLPMIVRGPRGTVINPGSVLGVHGVPTSYSFAVLDPDSLAARIFDIRTGREIRRDPVFLDDE